MENLNKIILLLCPFFRHRIEPRAKHEEDETIDVHATRGDES